MSGSRAALVLAAAMGTLLPGAPAAGSPADTAPSGGGVVAVGAPHLLASTSGADVGAPALSGTGRYAAYLSRSRTPAGALRTRLLRTDTATGDVVVLNPSVSGGVASAANYSFPPVISADGQRVGYVSNSPRLVADDTNDAWDAFVRDVPTAMTLLASRALDGGMANGSTGSVSLSESGRYAVFTSGATNLARWTARTASPTSSCGTWRAGRRGG